MRLVVGVECECLGAQRAGDRPSIAHSLAVVVCDEVWGAGIGAAVLAGVHVYGKEGFDNAQGRISKLLVIHAVQFIRNTS